MPEKLSQGPKVGYDAKVGAGLSRGPNLRKKTPAAPWSGTWPAPGATLDLDFANNRGFVRGVGQGGAMDAVTFTRASVGRFVNEQGLLDESNNNQPRFDWASTAQLPLATSYEKTEASAGITNLITYSEEFDNANWSKENITVTQNSETAPNGTLTADQLFETTTNGNHFINRTNTLVSGIKYTASVRIKKGTGVNARRYIQIRFRAGGFPNTAGVLLDLDTGTLNGLTGAGIASLSSFSVSSLNDGWFLVEITNTATANTNVGGLVVVFALNGTFQLPSGAFPSYAGSTDADVYVWGAQLQVSQATNTPLTANPTSNGLLIEESRTNRILWNRDATQANWVSTNITAAKDQTGIDGVANAASSLTATSADGTCIQTITLASGSRTGSVYLKRLTGTGTVQVSLNGSTWSTVDLSDTEWRRVVLSGTVTNPTVGIKIATSGDAVAMDYAQVEDGAFATTPILTTTATVTRSADVASMSGNNFLGWYVQQKGTIRTTFVCRGIGVSPRISLDIGVTGARISQYVQSSTVLRREVSGGSNTDTTVPFTTNTEITTAYAFQNNDFAASDAPGFSVSKSFAGQVPFARIAQICNFNGTGSFLNGTIKRVCYVPVKLSDSAIQSLVGEI